MNIAKKIKLARIEKDLTQAQLAQIAGLSTHTIGEIERGRQNLNIDTLNKVAAVLDLELKIELL